MLLYWYRKEIYYMNKKRNEEFENIIKNNINNLFIKSKKNKNELARYLDVTPTTISKYCEGIITPSIESLIKIAKFFDVTLFEVIGIDKDDNITNEEYHIIEAYRNLSDDLKLAINRILQIDMWFTIY